MWKRAILLVLVSLPGVARGQEPAFQLRELQTIYLWAESAGCELFLGADLRSDRNTVELKIDQERCNEPFARRRAGLSQLWQRLVRQHGRPAVRLGAVRAPLYPEAAERLAEAALASAPWKHYLRRRRLGQTSNALVLELMRASNAYSELLALLREWGQDCALSAIEKVAELTGREQTPSPGMWRPRRVPRGMRVPYPLLVYLSCQPEAATRPR